MADARGDLAAAGADVIQIDEPWLRNDTNLVAIVGRELMADKYFPLVNQNHRPEDILAADNKTRAGRAQNRRVTIDINPPDSV